MEINVRILVKLLIANGAQEYITRAIEIEAESDKPQQSILCQVNKSDLGDDWMFEEGRSWGYLTVPVLSFDMYKLKEQYLVSLPNGKTKWTSNRYSLEVESVLIKVQA